MTNRDVDFPTKAMIDEKFALPDGYTDRPAGTNADDLGPRYIFSSVLNVTKINKLNLGKCGIVIDLETGEVLIPAELPLSDAAMEFWKAVEQMTGFRPPGFW